MEPPDHAQPCLHVAGDEVAAAMMDELVREDDAQLIAIEPFQESVRDQDAATEQTE